MKKDQEWPFLKNIWKLYLIQGLQVLDEMLCQYNFPTMFEAYSVTVEQNYNIQQFYRIAVLDNQMFCKQLCLEGLLIEFRCTPLFVDLEPVHKFTKM